MPSVFHSIKCIWLLLLLVVMGGACNKQKFLDQKPTTTLLVPSTLSDFQALMDYIKVFGFVPVLGETSADDYYVSYKTWQLTLGTRENNAYIWAKDIYGGQGVQQDYDLPYQQVFYTNVVLDGLKNVKPSPDSAAEWNALEGAALFCRAFAFYNLAQLFAPAYDPATASTDMGIALRLSPTVDTLSARSSVQATYDRILDDLHSAESYLPSGEPGKTLNRPVRVTAQALLARVYLSMRNYPAARACADSALQAYSTLIDYNDLSLTSPLPIVTQNPETIYQACFLGNPAGPAYFTAISGNYPTTWIDTNLIRSYDTNDLRRSIFYKVRSSDTIDFFLKGNYTGTLYPFGGLAVDELLLISAEGAARAGDIAAAAKDINTMLNKRWKKNTFSGYSFASKDEALDTVLLERRKELAFRGLRWTDIRRLNKEGANITLTRFLPGPTDTIRATLAPNSLNYTLPIPPDVLSLNALIQQNPRN
jgi:hypothetical protein